MKTLCFVLLIGSVLTGCAPVYIPNSRPVPVLSKSGDVYGAINYSLTRANPSGEVDLQMASALTNQIAVMAGYSFSLDRSLADSIEYKSWNHVNTFWEAGVGYFQNTDQKVALQVFAGYGRGSCQTEDSNHEYHGNIKSNYVSATYTRFFIQPSVFLTVPSKHVRKMIVTARVSWVDVDNYIAYKRDFLNPKPALFIEPSFTYITTIVPERIFINLQAGVGFSNNLLVSAYDSSPFTITAGLSYRFSLIDR
jgi:hypothetical protein